MLDPTAIDSIHDSEADFCSGCRALELRVEKLEAMLAAAQVQPVDSQLGTTACYWICVGVHALFAFLGCANEMFVTLAWTAFLPFIATLAVCHVLTTRSILHRFGRTVLSCTIIVSVSLLALQLGEIAEPSDILPFLLMVLPPAITASWLTGKLFVWVAGWRIVPPGKLSTLIKLQIRHLMICTLVVAGLLAVGRATLGPEDWDSDYLMMAVFAVVPCMFCTVITSVLARSIMTKSKGQLALSLTLISLTSLIAVVLLTMLLTILAGEFDSESMILTSLYSLPMIISMMLSSLGTFTLMKSAGYTFTSNKLEKARRLETEPSSARDVYSLKPTAPR